MPAEPMPVATGGTPPKRRRGPRPKHVPQRTCIACRTAAPKRSFVRLVRLPTGGVEVDPTGKRSGRGASLCASRACWARALGGGLIERALRVQLSEEERGVLRAYMAALPEDEAPATAPPPATAGAAPERRE